METHESLRERFTDRARRVFLDADHEARGFNHEFIGTEHLLLGLLKQAESAVTNTLQSLNLDYRKARQVVLKFVQPGHENVIWGELQYTPNSIQVIEFAIEEARAFNHDYVSTEHILLGLLRVREGIAAHVFLDHGLKLTNIRRQLLSQIKT